MNIFFGLYIAPIFFMGCKVVTFTLNKQIESGKPIGVIQFIDVSLDDSVDASHQSSSEFQKQLIALREKAHFYHARSTNTTEEWLLFITRYPESNWLLEVRESENNIAVMQADIQYLKEQIDTTISSENKILDLIAGWTGLLQNKYLEAPNTSDLWKQYEKHFYKEALLANELASWQRFFIAFPNSVYWNDAREEYISLVNQEVEVIVQKALSSENSKNDLERNKIRVDELRSLLSPKEHTAALENNREAIYFAYASIVNSVAGWSEFIQLFPESKNKNQALSNWQENVFSEVLFSKEPMSEVIPSDYMNDLVVHGGPRAGEVGSWIPGKRKGGGINFHELETGNNNYRSALPPPDASLLLALQDTYGIDTIITLNGDQNGKALVREAKKLGLKSIYVPLTGSWRLSKRNWQKIKDALNNGNTLVHCTHGADRTGAIIARYYIEEHDKSTSWAFKDAIQFGGPKSDMYTLKEFVRYGL
jgi:hypothetical protein